jgi:hypothetical protein
LQQFVQPIQPFFPAILHLKRRSFTKKLASCFKFIPLHFLVQLVMCGG